MSGPPKLAILDRVRVTLEGRTVDAVVVLASPNCRSAALHFEALLGGYAGMMPILWNEERGEFVDLIRQRRVTVEPIPKS